MTLDLSNNDNLKILYIPVFDIFVISLENTGTLLIYVIIYHTSN